MASRRTNSTRSATPTTRRWSITDGAGHDPGWEDLRTTYARRAPHFLQTLLPDYDIGRFHFVRHHVAHAASAGLVAPFGDCAVLVADGRGEATSMLAGEYRDQKLDILAAQHLPHSLGLLYEDLTAHLGFERSSDEYKVMAMASYGTPRHLPLLRQLVYTTGDGGFRTERIDWEALAPARRPGAPGGERLRRPPRRSGRQRPGRARGGAAGALLLAVRPHRRATNLALAGGTALNCVANTRLLAEGPFTDIWPQPAAGDSGTALGAALTVAAELGDRIAPMEGAALGRGWTDDEIEEALRTARVRYERPPDIAEAAAR